MTTKVDVRKLKENEVVFIKESNICEKRLYRYNEKANHLEYSDDKLKWAVSKLDVEYLNSLNLMVSKA